MAKRYGEVILLAQVGDPEIDDDLVEKIVEKIIDVAKIGSRIDNPDALLGKE